MPSGVVGVGAGYLSWSKVGVEPKDQRLGVSRTTDAPPLTFILIFYEHMNFSIKAFATHKLCLKKQKGLYVLKNLPKAFMCLSVLKL